MEETTAETWYEGKTFKRFGSYDAEKEPGKIVIEFRGENAEAEARAWFDGNQKSTEPYDAGYVYRIEGTERTMVLSWHDTYPWQGNDEDDDYDYGDYPEDDYEDELDDALSECSQLEDGSCGQAGSEYCDFECPFRDDPPEVVDVEDTDGPEDSA